MPDSIPVSHAGSHFRLGSYVCVRHKCKCDAQVDESHGLSCELIAARISRHAVINLIKRYLTTAEVSSMLQTSGVRSEIGK